MTVERASWVGGSVALLFAAACASGSAVVTAPMTTPGVAAVVAPATEKPDAQAETKAPAPVDDETAEAEVLASIRKVSPTECVITSHAVDLLFDHPVVLLRAARLVPERTNGVVTSPRLQGIRP